MHDKVSKHMMASVSVWLVLVAGVPAYGTERSCFDTTVQFLIFEACDKIFERGLVKHRLF